MMDTIAPGTAVIDEVTGKELIVLKIFDTPISEYIIYETPPPDDDHTVAKANKSYNEEEKTVDVVYRESIINRNPDASIDFILDDYQADSDTSPGSFNTINTRVYSFPLSRLTKKD